DAKRFAGSDLHDKSGRRGIPSRVAAGFECCTQTAAGERRSVGLLLDEGGAVEFFDSRTVALDGKEGVVFFSCSSRERLEPVREVSYPFALGPLTNPGSDLVSYRAIDLFPTFNRGLQALIGFIT